MSRFSIDIKQFQSTLDEMEQYLVLFQQETDNILGVQRKLQMQVRQREHIDGQLNIIRSDLQKRQSELRVIVKTGREIQDLYAKTEKELIGGSNEKIKITNEKVKNTNSKGVTIKDKDAYINYFEKNNPEEAKRLETFLEGKAAKYLTEEDIRNIKYLTYTAQEPFRSIFLDSLSKFGIASMNVNGAFYLPMFHGVFYEYPDSFGNDPRGPYTTFFHECGHAIDDLSEEAKWIGSDTDAFKIHSDAMGRDVTLREAIEYDVYYNKDNPHSVASIAERVMATQKSSSGGNIDNVIKALRTGKTKSLNTKDKNLYNAVKNEFKRTTGSDATFEAVSDVYGGMTKNTLRTNWGHDDTYWNKKNNTSKELWAEYFSYNMAGDQANLDNLYEYFPEASKVLDQYAAALGE